MGNFFSLTAVENTKLWKRLSTKIMILILVGLVFGFCGLYKVESDIQKKQQEKYSQSTQLKADWKQQLKAQDISLKSQIDTMEKSSGQNEKSSLDSSKMELAENEYRISHNLKPQKDVGFWDYVLGGGYSEFVALFAIIACAGLVAGEFSDNTMKSMISRPFSRWQILTAKFISIFVYTLILAVLTYLTEMVSSAIFFGTGGAGTPQLLWLGGTVQCMSGFAASLITFGLDFLEALVFLIFAFSLSVVSRSRALATGLGIFLMFGGSFIQLLATHFSWGKLIFFAETNFTSFVRNGAPFYGITLGLAITICAIYCAVFIAGGYFAFAKRDIS